MFRKIFSGGAAEERAFRVEGTCKRPKARASLEPVGLEPGERERREGRSMLETCLRSE